MIAAGSQAPVLWSIIPFVGILLSIAILPLLHATAHWWENNRNRLMVSLVFAGLTLVYYALAYDLHKCVHILEHAILDEYIPFMLLLFSLYVITGGISLKGDLPARPEVNTAFLAVGATIASVVGTTGASMLLIRPLLKINSGRTNVVHTVIFFIFLVSNIGGCLLPIGDPPLFLGYLRGVPFLWTLILWKEWAFLCAFMLVLYYIWDCIAYRREILPPQQVVGAPAARISIDGSVNFIFLMAVVFGVAVIKPGKPVLDTSFVAFPFLREIFMLAMTILSLYFTPRGLRQANHFNYNAIIEVAALFIGIFVSMQPPLEILRANGDAIGGMLDAPWKFFWTTGILSSFLDNAPTYIVFFQVANSMTHEPGPGIFQLLDGNYIRADYLIAISLGAVFMGANTYIGNGPNFMVKSIAEQAGVRMPSFFGYMLYSLIILMPLFLVVTLLFL